MYYSQSDSSTIGGGRRGCGSAGARDGRGYCGGDGGDGGGGGGSGGAGGGEAAAAVAIAFTTSDLMRFRLRYLNFF